ncbi:M23 family metallopeptidase, partial [Phormidium sp. CCY1219]|uniref:M23 family metallopeptidase n=1 Tax=Phormidium sp. CCY1219 TaxID=2886104 RepID=UPI002D1F4890
HDAETGAGLLNMTAAVHLAKVTKPEEHSTPALLSPETWSGEGVYTPGERAVQNVIVPPEWRRWYYGWLNDSNPSDTFAFSIDEPTPLQFSLNVLGSAVLRKNGQVVLEGKYDGTMLYAGADGKLDPGTYVLTVDRGNLSRIDEYKLVMNFVEGSQGKEMPIVDHLPSPEPVQPPPDNPPVTDISEWIKKMAEKRAEEAILEAYEAQKGKLGNALEDIQVHWKAFNGVNVPAVQYFDGGYIIWNGVSAIPYFTGTGHKLPNLDLPETIAPIWQPTPKANRFDVPDGRHTYPNMRGSSEYWVELDGNKNDISLAARDTTLAHPDLRTTVYRDFGGGRLRQVPLTDINSDDNYLNYKDLPPGKYLIKVDVEQNKANIPYRMIVNLDQAGDTGIKAWNINRESVNGKLAGQRIVRSDHVGLPSGDRDLYVFTTDDMATQLRFAVRSQDSDGSEADRQRLLDGDVRVRILDEGGKQIGEPVDSKSREPLFGAQWLEPNSKYYAEVTALNGTKTNYDVVLNFNRLKADGRYEFTNLQGEFDYEFTVDGTNRDLKTAVRSKNGQDMSNIYRPVLYRKVNGTEKIVTPTSTANGISHYETLPKGYYRMVADPILAVHPHLLNQKYTFVHNLDQAGQHRSDARDLGNIGGKRVTKNDFVGKDRTDEVDYYKFSTGSDPYLLQFAVRHGSGNDNLRLEGDVEFALYDKNGKELKKVNSSNLKSIYGTYELKPNSEYYVRVKDKSGDGDGGNYHLVLNAEVKRNTGGGSEPNPTYIYKESDYLNALYQDGTGNRITSRRNDGYHNTGRAFDSYGGKWNSSLYALVGGEVIEAKNGKQIKDWGYNGTVAIYNRELNKTFIYWHLVEGSINESLQGKIISPGTLIGREGNTGLSYGVHTHVEIHNGRANANMSNPSYPQSPANSGRLHIPSIFQEAVRKGLVKLYR